MNVMQFVCYYICKIFNKLCMHPYTYDTCLEATFSYFVNLSAIHNLITFSTCTFIKKKLMFENITKIPINNKKLKLMSHEVHLHYKK